jgi:hypothetical protein
LWSSTSASWIDLKPPASPALGSSVAYGIWVSPGGVPHVVGEADTPGGVHASYWNATAASWVDLSLFLPDGWWNSSATGVWSDGQNVYVSGYARYTVYSFQYEAFLWWRPLQSPITPYCFGDGSGAQCPCGNNAPPGSGGGCLNSAVSGIGAALVASGDSSLSNDTLVLRAARLTDTSCLFFQGTSQQSGGAGATFGDGLRCASGVVTRLGTRTSVGSFVDYPSGADPSVSVRGGIASPGTRTYQVWYRNAAVFCTADTFNLTNGLSVIWSP